ncbi:hypothetical protein QQ045_006107 [Rhodiola kirilowii]
MRAHTYAENPQDQIRLSLNFGMQKRGDILGDYGRGDSHVCKGICKFKHLLKERGVPPGGGSPAQGIAVIVKRVDILHYATTERKGGIRSCLEAEGVAILKVMENVKVLQRSFPGDLCRRRRNGCFQ